MRIVSTKASLMKELFYYILLSSLLLPDSFASPPRFAFLYNYYINDIIIIIV